MFKKDKEYFERKIQNILRAIEGTKKSIKSALENNDDYGASAHESYLNSLFKSLEKAKKEALWQ